MSEQRNMKNYNELEFKDDFMFSKIMEDSELCREVLECLLQRPVGTLTQVQTQREFRFVSDGKPIRLDVYNEDSEHRIYDTEMQNLNNKSLEWLALPKRSRFYQAAIDIDHMDKNDSYKSLPESNIMFVCTFDPFKRGLSQYTFRENCVEDPQLELNDGVLRVFYNASYKGDDIPEGIRELYDYIEQGRVGGRLTGRIDAAVTRAKRNKEWRSQYMKERVLLQDAREEGREEGIEQSIKNMLRRGKTVQEIVDFCGYPYEQVKKVEDVLLISAK